MPIFFTFAFLGFLGYAVLNAESLSFAMVVGAALMGLVFYFVFRRVMSR